MSPHYTYLLVDVCSVIVPFLFSFGPKIAFYKQWRYLWLPMLSTAAVFIAWDVAFTHAGIWSFSDSYTLPVRWASLPVEEWLFFLAIPYSCVFIYASLNAFFPLKAAPGKGWGFTAMMGLALMIVALVFYKKAYTCSAFGGCGAGLLLAFFLRKRFTAFRVLRFFVAYTVCLIPFFIVNGILTALPVVSYNDAENLGIRLYTIPLEDVFYGMLMVLGSIWGMEAMRGHRKVV